MSVSSQFHLLMILRLLEKATLTLSLQGLKLETMSIYELMVDERRKFFDDLDVEITRCITTNENFILIGDLNAKLDSADNFGEQWFSNGSLLSEVMKRRGLMALDFTNKCSSKWTRVNTKNASGKSILDYVVKASSWKKTSMNKSALCLLKIKTVSFQVKTQKEWHYNNLQ